MSNKEDNDMVPARDCKRLTDEQRKVLAEERDLNTEYERHPKRHSGWAEDIKPRKFTDEEVIHMGRS